VLPDRDIETAHVPMIFGSAADDRRPGFRHDGVKSFLIRASDDVSLVGLRHGPTNSAKIQTPNVTDGRTAKRNSTRIYFTETRPNMGLPAKSMLNAKYVRILCATTTVLSTRIRSNTYMLEI